MGILVIYFKFLCCIRSLESRLSVNHIALFPFQQLIDRYFPRKMDRWIDR